MKPSFTSPTLRLLGGLLLLSSGCSRSSEKQRDAGRDAATHRAIREVDNDEGADGPLMTEDDVVSAIAKDGHVPVLLTGQSGTERERMGRYLHRKGPRSNGPFVAMRCETVHDGSFAETILSADGGTLYLEAIDKLPPAFQAKLTEVLREDRVLLPGSKSEKRFDVRFIFSADGDLRPKVRGGTFREDLYYRMSVTQLHLPLGTRAEER